MPTKERTPIRRGPGDEPSDVKRVAAAEGVIEQTGEPIEMAESAGPKKLEKMSFFDMLAALTPREWEDRLVYLYRSGEKGNNINIVKADPKDNLYIERISHAFDESYVKQKHGGGQFLAILKNTRVVNGAERKYTFRVDGPPIIHDDEIAINRKGGDASGGKTELAMVLKQLSDVQDRMLQMAQNTSGTEKDAITKAVETMQVGMQGALKLQQAVFEKSANSTTGNPMVDKFLESAMAKMNAAPGDPMEQFTKTLRLLKELTPEAKPSGGGGLLGNLTEIKGLIETLKELGFKVGGGEAAEGAFDWKAALAQNIPGALGTISQWVTGYLQVAQDRNRIMAAQIEQQRRGAVPPAALPGQVQTSAPAAGFTQPAPIMQHNPSASPAAAGPGSALPHNFAPGEPGTSGNQAEVIAFPVAGAEPSQEGQVAAEVEVDLNFVCTLIRTNFDGGNDGGNAAEMLKSLYGDALEAFAEYFKNPEQLKSMAGMHPLLATIVQHENFPVYLAEFCREMNRIDDEDGEENTGPETGGTA